MINIGDFIYKGVTVTIQRRPNCGHSYEFGYATSNGITGIGQDSDQAAEVAAKRAIDQHIEDKHLPYIVCVICGARAGIDCLEVFGLIAGIESGCTACTGVTHFPDHDEIDRRLMK